MKGNGQLRKDTRIGFSRQSESKGPEAEMSQCTWRRERKLVWLEQSQQGVGGVAVTVNINMNNALKAPTDLEGLLAMKKKFLLSRN